MISHPDRRINVITSYFANNSQRACSALALAELVNLSVSRLRHLCKAETGRAPAQYLKALRLQKAAELLATTTLSVKQIRYQVGMDDKKHFAQDFKKAYSMTPSAYRQQSPPLFPK